MTTTTKTRAPLFEGDRFEKIITLVMTLIVIQTAVITYWFTLAEDASGDAARDSEIYALEGLGKRTVGTIRLGYEQTGAFQSWLEFDTLARLAAQRGNTAQAAQLRAVRDRLPRLSPLLTPPYFKPGESVTPDVKQYEIDTFLVESVILAERFDSQSRLKTQWSDRSSSYTVMLTVLAVTLFLLGISGSSPRLIRKFLFAVGVVLALIVLGWMLLTYAEPVRSLPDEAIEAYADGIGKYYTGDLAGAVAGFDRAIAASPTYANAYRDRAASKYFSGDVAGAAADFESALDNGDTSSEVMSGLGFVYYILGNFDAAALLHEGALDGKPEEMWIRANRALNMLASGQLEEARTAYDALLEDVARTVGDTRTQGKQPPAALWYDFEETALDLEMLAYCAAEQVCRDAPPFETLQNPSGVAEAAQELATRMREYSVALEYTGQPPPATTTARADPFRFTRVLAADKVTVSDTESFAATDEPIYVSIPFRGLTDGQQIVLKVYVDGVEDDRLRFADEYSSATMGGADGDLLLPLTTGGIPFSQGTYEIEMYVDGKLVQSGEFSVTP